LASLTYCKRKASRENEAQRIREIHRVRRNSKHLAPVLFNGVIGSTEVITWNSWRNMVWDMHIYVMAKDLYPVKLNWSDKIPFKRQHVPMIISLDVILTRLAQTEQN